MNYEFFTPSNPTTSHASYTPDSAHSLTHSNEANTTEFQKQIRLSRLQLVALFARHIHCAPTPGRSIPTDRTLLLSIYQFTICGMLVFLARTKFHFVQRQRYFSVEYVHVFFPPLIRVLHITFVFDFFNCFLCRFR